jgi:hypothetical protein
MTRIALWFIAKFGHKLVKKISPAIRVEIIKWVISQESHWLTTPNKFDDLLPPLFKAVFNVTQEEIRQIAFDVD